MKILKILRMIL